MADQHIPSFSRRLARMLGLGVALGALGPLGAQQGSLPSPYGPEDTLGAANNLSAEIVREAAGLVPGGTAINRAELDSAMARQETEIRAGDVVLLHTGSLQLIDSDPGAFMASVAGLGVEGAEYLAGLGVVAVGIDTWALDVIPGENPEERLPVHSALLVRHGVYILENIRTVELARDGAYEFLFVLAAPRFVGAVQSPVHPVAIR